MWIACGNNGGEKMKKGLINVSLYFVFIGLVFGKSIKNESNKKIENNLNNIEKLSFQIYGSDYLISIPLPNYWNVDMDVAQQNNFNGFFYIKKEGINNSPAYIFINLYEKQKDKTFSDFINYMVTSLKDYQLDYSVVKVGKEQIKRQMNNWNVEIYDVKIKSGHGHYQKIVYMECEHKYYVEIYIDCYRDDYLDNDKFINDFIECYHEIDYLNIQRK